MKVGYFPASRTTQGLPKSLAGLKYLVECACEANALFTWTNPRTDVWILCWIYCSNPFMVEKGTLCNFIYTIQVTSHFCLIGMSHLRSVKTAIFGIRQDMLNFLQTISFQFISPPPTPPPQFVVLHRFLFSPSTQSKISSLFLSENNRLRWN